MGLNSRCKGRGREKRFNFYSKNRHEGGMIGPGQMFRPGPPGMFSSPVRFYSQAPYEASIRFEGSSGVNFRPLRPSFGELTHNNLKKDVSQKINNGALVDIDLSKPWVTEETVKEETEKQELVQLWRESTTDEWWNGHKNKTVAVQSLYDKAKTEYASSHPVQANLSKNILTTRDHYCETCDRSFRTDKDFFLHEAEHETCGRDGCEFTAHPKIIAKHIKVQHLSGLYKRIGKLYSEEDIAKWIEERKKRYPTRKLVEEKKILEEEKLSRGERINENNSTFNKQFYNKNKSNSKKKFKKKTQRNNRNRRLWKKQDTLEVQKNFEELSAFRKGVSAFLGIRNGIESDIKVKKDLNISDEEWETECKIPESPKPLLNNSLKLLAAFYDSEEENNVEECKKVKEDVMIADENSDPEEVVTVFTKNLLLKENSFEKEHFLKKKFLSKKDNKEERKQNTSNDCYLQKDHLTLLEKLLKKEIRHERNIILQCVHYVVKNNFFKA